MEGTVEVALEWLMLEASITFPFFNRDRGEDDVAESSICTGDSVTFGDTSIVCNDNDRCEWRLPNFSKVWARGEGVAVLFGRCRGGALARSMETVRRRGRGAFEEIEHRADAFALTSVWYPTGDLGDQREAGWFFKPS
jgi:hypothetical protein